MAFATLNGDAVFDGTICIPRVGAWHADLGVNSQSLLSGRATLAIDGGLKLVGTAYRSGVRNGTARMRIVGGNGGLSKTAKAKHYTRPNLRVILGDLLSAAGERLAARSSAATLALGFQMWTTLGLPIGRMIAALMDDQRLAGSAWRVLPDGAIWVGAETWPDSGLVDVVDFQTIDETPEGGVADLGVEAPTLLPGTTLDGRRVSYVEHRLTGEGARTRAWFE